MPAPTFDLPVSGSAPNNYATEASLEAQINAGFSSLYAQSRNGYQTSGVVRLANVAGDGQAVTGAIPATLVDFTLQHGVEFSVSWPATNTAANPTLAVTDANATYTMTLQTQGGGAIEAGQLVAGRIYLIRMMSNTTARVHGALTGDNLVETDTAVRLTRVLRDKLAAMPTGDEMAADIAAVEAQIDALSAASISGVAGPFATVAAGVAAVTNGAQFLVAAPSTGRVDLYTKTSGVGVYQMEWSQVRDMATRAGFSAAVASGLTHADGVTVTAGGRQYVASTGATALPGLSGWLPAGTVTLDHFGAVGDGVASDQAAWAAARTYGRAIYLPAGRSYLVTDPANTLGVEVYGPGRMVVAVEGGYRQVNIDAALPVVFRNHLWRVKSRIIAGESVSIVVFGDSTVTVGYGLDVAAQVQAELENNGVGVSSIINAAVAGHAWGTQNLATILTGYGVQKSLAMIKFGINDAGGPPDLAAKVATLRNSMRQRLAEIRASTYGAAAELSILLVMPNALQNASGNANNDRNNVWLESIRGVYVEAARDYECAIYDPYPESANANGGDAKWLDAGVLVHPATNYNLDIWTRAIRETLVPGGTATQNRVLFRKAADGSVPVSSGVLTDFPRGVSVFRTPSGGGYPVSGTIVTIRHPDGTGMQSVYGYQEALPLVRTRTWITGSGVWSEWSGGSVTLPLGASLAQTASTETAVYSRDLSGVVSISGTVTASANIAVNAVLATLPAGHRPAVDTYRLAVIYGGTNTTIRLRIKSNGEVVTETAITSGQIIYFPRVEFSAA